jgi:hypothetical protein
MSTSIGPALRDHFARNGMLNAQMLTVQNQLIHEPVFNNNARGTPFRPFGNQVSWDASAQRRYFANYTVDATDSYLRAQERSRRDQMPSVVSDAKVILMDPNELARRGWTTNPTATAINPVSNTAYYDQVRMERRQPLVGTYWPDYS